jgi:succinate dehydrogenase / fumarate reductase flavoprotein subunit
VLISEAVRGEGAYLINDLGDRFMANYPISKNKMELAPRDITSRNIATEIAAGRGINGGQYVHLDVRHLGKERIESRIPFAREEGMRLLGIDCVEEPLPVRPTAHYSMGGIPANIDCQVIDRHSQPVPGSLRRVNVLAFRYMARIGWVLILCWNALCLVNALARKLGAYVAIAPCRN